ncbi:hypothetical protein HG530_005225 [Fusarium avenaceum]|nr:hypothetical protein HG530_005225 [Fusarium avenaceum]
MLVFYRNVNRILDDEHLKVITNLNVTLNRTIEGILDDGLDLCSCQRTSLTLLELVALSTSGNVLVLEVDLVVEEGHDQTARSTTCSALLPLVTSHGVVRVHGTLALLIQTAEHRMRVVREESLPVEDCGETLGAGVDGHRLAVAVTVDLADGVEVIAEGLAIGSEANDG